MIQGWLKQNSIDNTNYQFSVIRFTEKSSQPDRAVEDYLSKALTDSYVNSEHIKFLYKNESKDKLIDHIQSIILPDRAEQISKNVMIGEWGETLARLIVQYVNNLEVPLQIKRKFQDKRNKDKAVMGMDLFAHAPDIMDGIYCYEVKTRSSYKAQIAVDAHNSLSQKKDYSLASIANFLSRKALEDKDQDAANKYGDIVKNPDKYSEKKYYEIFLVLESAKYDKKIAMILQKLNNEMNVLEQLSISIILIDGLQDLINRTFDGIPNMVCKYVHTEGI